MTLVIVVVVAIVAIALLAWYSARDSDRRSQAGWAALQAGETPPARIQGLSALAVPRDVQDQARSLAASGHRAQAVRVIQTSTNLPLRDAAGIVDGLRFGYAFPTAESDPQTSSS